MKYNILFILICAFALGSCSKSKDKTPVCKITDVNSNRFDPRKITYNKEGKPLTITYGTQKVTYTYSGNTVTVLLTNNNVFLVRYITTLHNNGLAESVRVEQNESGTDWRRVVYVYNGEELTKITNVSSAGIITYVTNYTWSGGNPVLVKSDGGSDQVLEYYTDKPYDKALLPADGIYWESLRPKNLLKKIILGTDYILQSYDFDADGKVVSHTITGNATPTTTYLFTYACD